MAKLYIQGFQNLGRDSLNAIIPGPAVDRMEVQTLEITDQSIAGEPFGEHIHFISIIPDEDCFISIGYDPTATREYSPVYAGERLYFGIRGGERVAVISAE